jgi:hypothetical protein
LVSIMKNAFNAHLSLSLCAVDDDECSRGNSICPTNSFCRNTPGSYAVGVHDRMMNIVETRRSSVIVSVAIRCWLNERSAKVNRAKRITSPLVIRSTSDIDECQTMPDTCEQKCINVQGSYYVNHSIRGDRRLERSFSVLVFMQRRLSVEWR